MNAWLVAGAVVGTGLLTDVAAQAFPGRTIKLRAGIAPGARSSVSLSASTARGRHHHALTPPAKAPRAHRPIQVVEPVAGQTPAATTPAPATPAPATQAAPAPAATAAPVAPAVTPAPVTPAPVAPAPVVSGGS